jgi:hypothetical protein
MHGAMTSVPLSREARRLAGVSLAVTIAIGLLLAFRKAGLQSPFAGVSIYNHLLLFQDYYAVAPYAIVAALALLAPVRELGLLAASWCGRHPGWTAIATTFALAAGSRLVYHAHPLSMDEYALVFQSEVFAEGRLTGKYPAELIDWIIPNFFQGRFLAPLGNAGDLVSVVSVYWPGYSLLLTPFTLLGVPWLLNPLLCGGTVFLMHALGLRLFGNPEAAGLVVLLTIASPAVTINGISFYSMPGHLLANGLYLLLLLDPTPRRAFFAGAIGSLALVLHNPVPHLLFALPWLVWLAMRPDRLRLLIALVAGYLPGCLLLGFGWSLFLGQYSGTAAAGGIAAAGANLLYDRVASIGTTVSSLGLASRPLDLAKLWLWSAPGMMALALLGGWQLRRERSVWWAIAASGLLTYFGYFLVPFDQGHGWGARYFHSAWLVLPLLAVRALRAPNAALSGYLAGCALLSLVFLTSLRALQVEQFIDRHLAQLPAAAGGEAKVLILDGRNSYYGWDLVRSDPFFRDEVKVFMSRGAERDAAMMATRYPAYRLLASDKYGWAWGIPAR